MDVFVEKSEDKAVIILEKNVSVGVDAAKVQNTILDLIEEGNKTIVADLSRLNFITSWGIGILIYAFTTCSNKGVDFYLVGVGDRIESILKKIRVDQIIEIKEK